MAKTSLFVFSLLILSSVSGCSYFSGRPVVTATSQPAVLRGSPLEIHITAQYGRDGSSKREAFMTRRQRKASQLGDFVNYWFPLQSIQEPVVFYRVEGTAEYSQVSAMVNPQDGLSAMAVIPPLRMQSEPKWLEWYLAYSVGGKPEQSEVHRVAIKYL